MRPPFRLPGRGTRRIAIAACLAAMLLAGLARFPLPTFLRHLRGFAELNALPPEKRRIAGTGFLFDRTYGEFLLALSKVLPPEKALCLAVPRSNESYVYEAVYMLAPRRVIVNAPSNDCDYVAVFPAPPDAAPGQRDRLLAGGLLRRLQ